MTSKADRIADAAAARAKHVYEANCMTSKEGGYSVEPAGVDVEVTKYNVYDLDGKRIGTTHECGKFTRPGGRFLWETTTADGSKTEYIDGPYRAFRWLVKQAKG